MPNEPLELTSDPLPEFFQWLEIAKSPPKKALLQEKVVHATSSPQWSPRTFDDIHPSEVRDGSVREESEDEWIGNDFQGFTFSDKLCEGQRYITEVERKIGKYQSRLRVELNRMERRMPKFKSLLKERPIRNRVPWVSASRPSVKARYTNKLLDLQVQLDLPRRPPPKDSSEPRFETPTIRSWPSTPGKDSVGQSIHGTPYSGSGRMHSPNSRPQVLGQRHRQAHALLTAADVCCSSEKSKQDLERALSFAKDAHKIFTELGDKRMQAVAHLAIMGVNLQDKIPREPMLGDEVEDFGIDSGAAWNEYSRRPGDRGRVSRNLYTDETDGIERFDVTWYQTGLTTTMKKESWLKNVMPLGNRVELLRLGDELEALPGAELTLDGIDYYRAGDRGRVSKDVSTGHDRIEHVEVTWYRTGLTSRMAKDVWLKNFRFIETGIHFPSLGDEVEALLSSSHDSRDTDCYAPGDKGKVIRETCHIEEDGMDQVEIIWYRTGLTSIVRKDVLLKSFHLSRSSVRPPRKLPELETPLTPENFDRSSSPVRRRSPPTGKDVDAPGRYRTVLDRLPVTSGRGVREVGKLGKDTLVEVLELSPETVQGRVRARIREPAGWISLRDEASKSQFAVAEIIDDHEHYRVVCDDLPVTETVELKALVTARLPSHTIVEVLEVSPLTEDGKIEARIKGAPPKYPDGWIVLRDEFCRFAVALGQFSSNGKSHIASTQQSPRPSMISVGSRNSEAERTQQAGREREQQEASERECREEIARKDQEMQRKAFLEQEALREKQQQQQQQQQQQREQHEREERERQARHHRESEQTSQRTYSERSLPASADSQNEESEEEDDYDYDEEEEDELTKLPAKEQSTHRRGGMLVSQEPSFYAREEHHDDDDDVADEDDEEEDEDFIEDEFAPSQRRAAMAVPRRA